MSTAEPLGTDRDEMIQRLPKVETHVHLEGSVRPGTLLRIARRHGLDLGRLDEARITDLFRFRSFRHFTELYEQCCAALRDPADLQLLTEELAESAHRQNVRHLEVTFSPGTHWRGRGIPFDEQLDAVRRGAEEAWRRFWVSMRFVVDHVRGESVEECQQIAEWAVAGGPGGVVGLGLGGFEPGRPASLFAEPIRWAAARGVPFVPHAGEAVGPEGIWDCLAFHPPRIAHGIRAVEDPALMRVLRDRGVVLDVCLTSNLRTGVVSTPQAHPLRRLWEAGVRITLNTDDPSMFHTDLVAEHRLAARWHGLTVAQLAGMTMTAVEAALLPDSARMRLREGVRAELDELGIVPTYPPGVTWSVPAAG
ncbi:adenosine deaminase [Micromonospora sp. C51]|uniref:adenosine deaminase n=1 Tax=Micromonospora sp. C51 TaxID=2824879 RepID=UPI001B39BC18|nr:adenosine deaminase [Micromonospora sp. C51]MBQ1052021.1 adenosine deaminase [Micromonospora sp. C51]